MAFPPCLRMRRDDIRPDEINLDDDRYRMRRGPAPGRLVESIRHLGVINPPVLQHSGTGYRIVCGFRRVMACAALGAGKIRSRLVEDQCRDVDCLRLSIVDNAMGGGLTVMEEARAVVGLLAFCSSFDDLPGLAEPLGIRANKDLAQKYERLCRLPEKVQALVGEDVISLKTALEMERLGEGEALAFAVLLGILRPGASQQRELLSGVKALAAIRETGIADVLESPPFPETLGDERLDRKQKIRKLISEIRRFRFPHISRFESVFWENVAKLDLDEGIFLIPPQDFESPVYRFALDFRDTTELAWKTESLKRICGSNELTAILKREIEDI